LNEVRVFLAAAEHSSFSEAAKRLNLSQPAVSQKIENLEKHFSVKLFRREGRSVQLTEAGRFLQPIAQELIAAAYRLEESMASINGAVIGEMQIGCSTISGKNLLPRLAARFRQQYPQVRIHIMISSWQVLKEKLSSGELVLGVTSRPLDHRDLEYFDFFKDEIILIAPRNHPWALSCNISPEDLLDEPFILREETSGTREVMREGLLTQNISLDMLNVAMVLENAEAIVMAVAEGIGIAFVSRLAAANDLELGRVVEVGVKGMCLSLKIYLARNRRIPPSHAQDKFWEFVQTGELLPAIRVPGS
jgi:DNA-binding transcriptional LysR family regulator